MLKKLCLIILICATLIWLRSQLPSSNPSLSSLNPVTLTAHTKTTNNFSAESVRHVVTKLQNRSFTQPVTVPLGVTNEYTATPGIQVSPQDATVFIISRGYAFSNNTPLLENQTSFARFPRTGGGFICASNWVKYLGITAPTISFDYLDGWRDFDFGLDSDKKCLTLVINEVIKQNNQVNIILIGSCKGSRSILHYMADKPAANIKALILDAPFESAQDLCTAIHTHYFSWLPCGNTILYYALRAWFPRYQPEHDLPATITKIPPTIPILIGHLKNDVLVTDAHIKKFIAQFENPDRLYTCAVSHPTITHSKLSHITAFQDVSNRFLQKYDLPHDPQKAQRGAVWLPITLRNSQHNDSWITIKSN